MIPPKDAFTPRLKLFLAILDYSTLNYSMIFYISYFFTIIGYSTLGFF
jgi:hypothetical protein